MPKVPLFGLHPQTKAAIEALNRIPNINIPTIPRIDLSRFAAVQQDALKIFPAVQQQFVSQSQQLEELQRRLEELVQPARQQWLELSRSVESARLAAISIMPKITPEMVRDIEMAAKTEQRQRLLDRIGLLPHASTPFQLFDSTTDPDTLKAHIQSHYDGKWSEIAQSVLDRVRSFDIDEEAKETLEEALHSHRNGFFRSVCRLLLPEIERVARVELQQSAVGIVKPERVIGEPALSLSISDTNPPGYYALGLYKRFTKHLYVKVDSTNLAQFAADPIPNRHAAIHGLIVYNSYWHSLNVIFLTDYVFQLVTAIKAPVRKHLPGQ